MKKDKGKIEVVFKKAHYDHGVADEVVAFFPEAPAKPGNILGYAHDGQHFEASCFFFQYRCTPCTSEEYAPLKNELEQAFGYRLEVISGGSARERGKVQPKKEEGGWLVLQAETDDANGGLWMSTTYFGTLKAAKRFVSDVIRNEWAAEIEVEGRHDTCSLADLVGYSEPPGSEKYADVYYSEDGDEAWVKDGCGMGCGKKIKIVKAGKEGVRVC